MDVTIYTVRRTRLATQDIDNFNAQYPTLNVNYTGVFHDRLLIIDETVAYHISCQLYIAVKNPVDECVQIDGRRLLTSKKDKVNHGIGSQNVRSIVEKYNGELNYVCEDGCFTAEVLV